MRTAKTAWIDCSVILSTRFYMQSYYSESYIFRRTICYHIQETYLKWKIHISYLALISLFVSIFTICSICQERPGTGWEWSPHRKLGLWIYWDQAGAQSLVQIIKNKAEPWLLFSAARLRAAQAHSGQDSLVASDSRNLGSQAGRAWEKMCEPQIGCWYP